MQYKIIYFIILYLILYISYHNIRRNKEKFYSEKIPVGECISIHYSKLDGFASIWKYFKNNSEKIKRISDISLFYKIYTKNMYTHYNNCKIKPDISKYKNREIYKRYNKIYTINIEGIKNINKLLNFISNTPSEFTKKNKINGTGIINDNCDIRIKYNSVLFQANGKFHCGNEKMKNKLHQIIKKKLGDHFIEIRGWFWYPPKGFREWHTNMFDPPGWRSYMVHVDKNDSSWFLIRNPITGNIEKINDKDGNVNFFKLNNYENLIWHTIYSETNRFSLGLYLTENYINQVVKTSFKV